MPIGEGTLQPGKTMQVCPPGLARSHENMGKFQNTKNQANLTELSLGSNTGILQEPGRSQGEGKRPGTKQGEPLPEGPVEQLMTLPKPSGEPGTPKKPQDHQPTRGNAPDLFICTVKTRPEGHIMNDKKKSTHICMILATPLQL